MRVFRWIALGTGVLAAAGCVLTTSLSGLDDGPSSVGAADSATDSTTDSKTIPGTDSAAPPSPNPKPDAGDAGAQSMVDASDAGSIADSAAARYAAAVMADAPIAYWRLAEKTGPTLKNEVSAYYTALYGGGATLGAPGIFGAGDQSAMHFTAAGGITVDSAAGTATFDFLGFAPFTFELWLQPDDATQGAVISNLDIPVGPGVGTHLYLDTHLRAERWIDQMIWTYAETPPTSSPLTLATDRFQHVAFVFSPAHTRIYIDGAPGEDGYIINPFDSGMLPSTAAFVWANDLRGTLDEIAVYDKELTQDQVAAHIAARQ